jgi:hypothetical protein
MLSAAAISRNLLPPSGPPDRQIRVSGTVAFVNHPRVRRSSHFAGIAAAILCKPDRVLARPISDILSELRNLE